MGSVNRVILVGNLGRDAELRYTQGGAAVASFSMATTESWKDKTGDKHEKVEWHKVNLWGKPAEAVADYLRKGKQIFVEGRLETRQWEDKSGNKRSTTEVKADRVVLLGSANGHSQRDDVDETNGFGAEVPAPRKPSAQAPLMATDIEDSDIPF